MSLNKKSTKRYRYWDYVTWPDEERWELIDGVAYDMSPAPEIKHQDVVGRFYFQLMNKLSGGPCRPFMAPVDVVFSEYDVVQPDVFVVCDKNKITKANIQGSPDLIVEVLSPSTALKDRRTKKNLYEKYSVREYILIHPTELYVERFTLKAACYEGPGIYGSQEVLPLYSLEGINIPLWEVFEVEKIIEKVEPEA